jgi:hypothetical protein
MERGCAVEAFEPHTTAQIAEFPGSLVMTGHISR